jgi:aminopeptidase N
MAARLARPLALCACALAAAAGCRATGKAPPPRQLPVSVATPHPLRECAYDVEHYALELEILPEQRRVRGTCRIRLWPREAALGTVDLDLEDLEVAAVRDERGRPLAFEQRPGTLRIALREPLQPGDCVEIAVDYAGTPRKGLYFAAERDGVPTQVFTQGECEDSRGWFPCFDAPSDRATSELRVTIPARWTALAAGERVERTEHDGRATELWRMTTPHPAYLTTLVAGEFIVKTGSWDGTPLEYLAEERLASEVEADLGRTGDVLAFLSQVTGRRYPYAKYAQACVADFPYGGMENISATTLTDTALVDEKGRRDGPQTGLVAHEAAHQWFGDLLTCRDWSHAWLNEGFATYMGALFTENDRGVDEFRAQIRDLQESYVQADVGKNRRPVVHAVYRRPMDLFFSGHVYAGGAVRLHLLRSVIGDEVFFRGLRLYVGRNAGRAVVTDDLRRAMEEASGADLAWFFQEWFEVPGFPEFESTWRYDERRKLLLLSVNQVQDIGGGTPAVFRTPVEIGVRDSKGLRTERLSIERRRQLFEIPAVEKPLFVRFDEHSWIPKRLDERKSSEEWLAIAQGDDDVNGRRDAVKVIAKVLEKASPGEERERLLAALLQRLASDPSSAVRDAAATGLSSVRDPAAVAALSKAASEDAEARVRCAALAALRGLGKDADLAELALREYRAAFSWGTMASAAALYIAAHPNGALDWLREQIALDSPQDALRSRLIPLLAQTRDARALPLLLRIALDERAPEAGRAAAAREIGVLGRGDQGARRALASLLSAHSWRVRREAIAALSALRDPGALESLRDLHARSALEPERIAIEAALQAVAGDG